MSLAAGLSADKGSKIWLAVGLVAGTAINYICGMAMFSIISGATLHYAFIACVLPFIHTAIIKIIVAAMLGAKIRMALIKSKLLV